jgi:hypothetical protein
MEKLTFTPNIPVQVALRFPDGKLVEGRFGDQVFYTTTDGKAMYLDMVVAAKINQLGIQAREPFFVCKRSTGRKGEPVLWDVYRLEEAVVPQQPQPTPTQMTGIDETDIERQVRAEVAARVAKQVAANQAGASVTAPAPAVTAASQPPYSNGNGSKPNGGPPAPLNGNGNGTNGAMRPYAAIAISIPPLKVPFNRAFTEVVQIVQNGLKETGEQWSDQARQDAVSTILIAATKEGWIGPWERQAR